VIDLDRVIVVEILGPADAPLVLVTLDVGPGRPAGISTGAGTRVFRLDGAEAAEFLCGLDQACASVSPDDDDREGEEWKDGPPADAG
jgi:hypothetical protein